MSQENVEIVGACMDAFNRRDHESWVQAFDAACEFWPMRAQLDGRAYMGHDGLRRFVREMSEEWEQVQFRANEIHALGGSVLATGVFEGLGRASGVQLAEPAALLFEVRDGKLVCGRFFSDPQEARKAAGLSE